MSHIELFAQEQIIGIFRGFRGSGFAFHADLVLPYRGELPDIPLHGQFLLVQLGTPYEALLGRIVSLSPGGKLSSDTGEDVHLRALREIQALPEEMLKEELKYRVTIHILGLLKSQLDGHLLFVASHRRQPHHGSWIAFPSGEVLREIVGHNVEGAAIGHFALGEFIYAHGSQETKPEDWMHVLSPEVLIRFSVRNLIARRSLVFARAGFGKSNFNKLCFSELYKETPLVAKRSNKLVPVGTIVFDPDGEYFWPDDKGRPGLCDVPELQEKLVVFTSREGPSDFYASFVADGIKVDLRELSASMVLSTALSAQKQDQQNVRKLKNLAQEDWRRLVSLIEKGENNAPLGKVCRLLGLEKKQEVEALAARANMTNVVQLLHDSHSRFLDMLLHALSQGKLCIIDISLLHASESLILSGLILRHIFDYNQGEFTKAKPASLPTIAVIEEAQSVLTERSPAAEPYRDWVKEGRKYDLGSLLITQQPGSIPKEILSQSDNWFALHLLSTADLKNLQRANSYFSQDILNMLLNEPLPGHAVFWSSVGGKPYPVSLRILSFEQKYTLRDPDYEKAAVDTFAQLLKEQFQPLPDVGEEDEFDEDAEEGELNGHQEYSPSSTKEWIPMETYM